MRENCLMKNTFRNRKLNCLNKEEKIFIATLIGTSFIKGALIGMYLSKK